MSRAPIGPRTGLLAATAVSATLAVAVVPHARAAAGPSSEQKAACVFAYENAQKLRQDGKMRDARQRLLSCVRDECPAVLRKDCNQWLDEVDQTMPTVVIAATGPDGRDVAEVRVSVDGQEIAGHLDGRPLALDPGVHTLRYETDGAPPVLEQIVVRLGEKNRQLTVTFEKRATPRKGESRPGASRPVPTEVYALGGLGAVAFVSFAYFGLKGRSEATSYKTSCAPYCSQADVDATRVKLIVADASLAVSLVSIGVATYLYLSRPEEDTRRRGASAAGVTLTAGPGAATVGYSGAF